MYSTPLIVVIMVQYSSAIYTYYIVSYSLKIMKEKSTVVYSSFNQKWSIFWKAFFRIYIYKKHVYCSTSITSGVSKNFHAKWKQYIYIHTYCKTLLLRWNKIPGFGLPFTMPDGLSIRLRSKIYSYFCFRLVKYIQLTFHITLPIPFLLAIN